MEATEVESFHHGVECGAEKSRLPLRRRRQLQKCFQDRRGNVFRVVVNRFGRFDTSDSVGPEYDDLDEDHQTPYFALSALEEATLTIGGYIS